MKWHTAAMGAAVLVLLAGYTGEASTSHRAAPPPRTIAIVHDGEADMKIYGSIEQVEADATTIIEAKLIGEKPAKRYVTGADGTVLDSYAVSKVQVAKVYKGKFKAGDIVEVAEPGYRQGDRYTTHEGYKAMDAGGRYLLFTHTSNKGIEAIVGLDQGKFDLNITEPQRQEQPGKMTEAQFAAADYVGDNVKHFNLLKTEALAKYL
ncbi:hypothetical protein [Paenibacillus sacheonensis]|uniref:Uncharacterized protein n=1 Tax=Paenibacillus sacheonensis TaxID=742054 RepID=A0A7X4YU75_9BACL|nr:hypothetical protein [Paenibacillus sacheonensis]MBM7568954.1 hypothetical protein [Paenibacillus sacheonensis]NBC72672.1 hypothetical protein [Paenibacillus sacheonensis]